MLLKDRCGRGHLKGDTDSYMDPSGSPKVGVTNDTCMSGGLVDEIQRVILLVLASAVVTVVARWIRLPYTLALLLLGLGIGVFTTTSILTLSSEIILLVFLPPLLFEAAFVLDLDLLWRRRRGVMVLALLGVIVATLVTGGIVYSTTVLPWSVAILFGAMIAATDPVAVLAMFRQLGVDPRLSVLLEGESLFNDGIALVLFSTLVISVASGFEPTDAASTFMWSVVGGIVIGLMVGGIGYVLLAKTDEHLTEMLTSVAVAYGAFLAAEELSASGVLATLAAGMALGRAGRVRMTLLSSGAEPLVELWAFLAFLANAALFLELGITIRSTDLLQNRESVLWGIVAAVAGRAAVAYGLGPLINRLGTRVAISELHVLFWGGLRGAVALAAALSLPADFPHQRELLAMTYGAVLFTLLVQGLTIGPLVRLLKLQDQSAGSPIP